MIQLKFTYMCLFLRTNSHDDVSVSTPVSTADEMTPRNMPAPHRSQVMQISVKIILMIMSHDQKPLHVMPCLKTVKQH